MSNDVNVELVGNDAERAAIYRLRYAVYIEELGWTSRYANHAQKTLTDNLDASGNLFVAFRDNQPVGTLRTHHSADADLGEYISLYHLHDSLRLKPKSIAIATMFVVRKSMRLSRIACQLMLAALKKALDEGIDLVFIECEPKMAPFYKKLGFAIHVPSILHPDYGPALCLSMAVNNCPLLAKLNLQSLQAAA